MISAVQDWKSHLEAAAGYLTLGMLDEAAFEIEEIAPEEKTRTEVLAFRLEIFRVAGKWEAIEIVSKYLDKVDPGTPDWIIKVAWAVRKLRGSAEARGILECAESRFPDSAILHYDLGCYQCLEGDLEGANEHLKRAFELQPSLMVGAIEDPDLDAIFGQGETAG
jgi:tetratricopeptide (TPR) repeat protein